MDMILAKPRGWPSVRDDVEAAPVAGVDGDVRVATPARRRGALEKLRYLSHRLFCTRAGGPRNLKVFGDFDFQVLFV